MTIEAAINTRLRAFTDLTDLIGGGTPRIHPMKMAQGELLPAIVYQVISRVRESVMGDDTDTAVTRVQINSIAATYSDLVAVSTEVRNALQRYRATVNGVEFKSSFIDNSFDRGYEPNADAGAGVDVGRFSRVQDFLITHTEA